MMRAFVTGGSGFIGGHLIDALLREGWRVSALARRSPLLQADRVTIVPGDVTDRAALEVGMKGADAVFHLASAVGSSAGGGGADDFRVNAAGTAAVLQAARASGARRVVHFSSAGVFGAVSDGDVASEDYPRRPILAYDRAKLEGEELARRAAAGGLDVVIVRPGWAYGPRDRRTFKLIRTIARGRFVLATRGTARQTPVFIDDLVAGTLAVAAQGRMGEVYHLAGREVLSARAMAEEIAEACGRRVPRFRIPTPFARLAAWAGEAAWRPLRREPPLNRAKLSFFLYSKALSIDKAVREIGFAPAVDFPAGIRLAVDWYRANGWL